MSWQTKSFWPAFEPFTPRGVAAYAYAPLGRLVTTQLIVAAVSAAAIVASLKISWCPVIRDAIRQLPQGSELRRQELAWTSASPMLLAENRCLGLVVDLDGSDKVDSVADLRVQFQKDEVRICSLLGCSYSAYPAGWRIAFDRATLEPWWGAREFVLLGGAGLLTLMTLMLNWAFLATLYFALVYFLAYLLDRGLTWSGSWRLAGAALMPGALFQTLGIIAYGVRGIGLLRLTMVFALHIVIGWVYVLLAPCFLRRLTVQSVGKNPFVSGSRARTGAPENPFKPRPD